MLNEDTTTGLVELPPLPKRAPRYSKTMIRERVMAEFGARLLSGNRNKVAADVLIRMLSGERLTPADFHRIRGLDEDANRITDDLKQRFLVPLLILQPGSVYASYGMRPAEIHKFMSPIWRDVQAANQQKLVEQGQDKRGCVRGLEMHRKYKTLAQMKAVAGGKVIPLTAGTTDYTDFAAWQAANQQFDDAAADAANNAE